MGARFPVLFISTVLIFSLMPEAGEAAKRRGILQGAGGFLAWFNPNPSPGGAPLPVTPPVVPSLPEASLSIAEAQDHAVRLHHLRLEFPGLHRDTSSKGSIFDQHADAELHFDDEFSRARYGTRHDKYALDFKHDILMDWARSHPDLVAPIQEQFDKSQRASFKRTAQNFAYHVGDEETPQITAAGFEVAREREILMKVTQGSWATMSWFQVFGERWARLERRVFDQQNEGTLSDIQLLGEVLLSDTKAPYFSRLNFNGPYSPSILRPHFFEKVVVGMLRRDPWVRVYSEKNLHILIEGTREFSPLLGEVFHMGHLSEVSGWFDRYVSPNIHKLFGFSDPWRSKANADFVTFSPHLRSEAFSSHEWIYTSAFQEFLSSESNQFSDELLESLMKLYVPAIHRLSATLEFVRSLPSSPLRDLMIPKLEEHIQLLTEEIARIPEVLLSKKQKHIADLEKLTGRKSKSKQGDSATEVGGDGVGFQAVRFSTAAWISSLQGMGAAATLSEDLLARIAAIRLQNEQPKEISLEPAVSVDIPLNCEGAMVMAPLTAEIPETSGNEGEK